MENPAEIQGILHLKGYSITQLLQGPDSLWSSFDWPRLQELQEGKGIAGPVRGTKLSSAPDRDAFSFLCSFWLLSEQHVRQMCFAPHPAQSLFAARAPKEQQYDNSVSKGNAH